jgi:hypothetical protein
MIIKRMAIASATAVGILCLGYAASAGPAAKSQAAPASQSALVDSKTALALVEDWASGDRGNSRRRYRHGRLAKHWYDGRRRNSGPPYSSCYMKCIYSSHPADFCRDVASDHFCY